MPASRKQLEQALINADRAGDVEAARALAAALKSRAEGTPLSGAAEVAMAIGSGMVAEPVAGIAGIAGAVAPGPPGQGAGMVESTRDAMTYQPPSATGQRYLGNFARFMEPLSKELEKGSEFFARRGEEMVEPFLFTLPEEQRVKGMAAGHAAGKSFLEGAAMAAGGKAATGVTRAAKPPKQPRIDPRVEGIERGDADVAGLRVDEKGKVRKDPAQQAVSYQGMEPGLVAAFRAAPSVDKKAMNRMLDIIDVGRKNRRAGATLYPSAVVGENIGRQIAHVAKVNRDAGKRIDGVAKSLKGQDVDYTRAVDDFIASLDEMGIGFKDNNLNFKGSDVKGLGGNEAVLKRVVDWMKEAEDTGAYGVHRLKRYLDQNVDYGKRQEGVGARVQIAIKDLRHDLDALLDDAFPEYKAVNQTYSETIDALKDYQAAVGNKIDFKSKHAARALGIESRKILSNYASGSTQLDGLEKLAQIANKHGGKFSDDIVMQTMFYVQLQRLFPETFRTSFKPEIQSAVEAAARQGPVSAAKETVAQKGIELVMGSKGEDELLKALRRLLAESPSKLPASGGMPVPRQ